MSLAEERVGETLEALAAICARLRLSLTRDAAAFPITAEEAGSDDHELWDVLDAFLQRFGQALDQTLRKLFPRLQSAISGSDELLPVRELLDALHRAGVIERVETWLQLLEVRNRLAHEYALDQEERATVLNDAWRRAPELIAQFERALDYAEKRHLLGDRT